MKLQSMVGIDSCVFGAPCSLSFLLCSLCLLPFPLGAAQVEACQIIVVLGLWFSFEGGNVGAFYSG